MLQQMRGFERWLAAHDVGNRHLAGAWVRGGYHRGFEYAGVGVDDALDFGWKNLETGADDHFLLAVDQTQVAVAVEGADVACAEVTVVGEGNGVLLGRCQ